VLVKVGVLDRVCVDVDVGVGETNGFIKPIFKAPNFKIFLFAILFYE
jgi:hypothetical protein